MFSSLSRSYSITSSCRTLLSGIRKKTCKYLVRLKFSTEVPTRIGERPVRRTVAKPIPKNAVTLSHDLQNLDLESVALLLVPTFTFALSIWQKERKKWKEGIIAELEKRTTKSPVELPENLSMLSDMEYCKVKVKGKFHHDKEILLGPRTITYETSGELMGSNKVGYLVITPFTLSDRNLTILVNRGWVPSHRKEPEHRKEGQVSGETEIVGIVRQSERKPGLFEFENKPEKDQWVIRDITEMALFTGAEPVLIDAVYESTINGGPIGGQTMVNVRNEHFTYIFIWATLTVITSWLWVRKYIPSLSLQNLIKMKELRDKGKMKI